MSVRRLAIVMAPLLIVVAACGGGGTPAPSGAASAGASAEASSAASQGTTNGGENNGNFTITFDGGSMAGTYTASSATGGCVVNVNGINFTLDGGGIGPDGQNLFLTAGGLEADVIAGTGAFGMSVAVGIAGEGGASVTYIPPNGNMKVTDNGSSMSMTANGDVMSFDSAGATENFKMTAEATCTSVFR